MANLSFEQEKRITRQLLNIVNGHWDRYLPMVLPEMADAVAANGTNRHVDCILPDHQGKNDMRCKNTKQSRFVDTGAVICTCTSKNPVSNGLDLIQRVRGCDFKSARDMLLDAVGGKTQFIGVDYTPPPKPAGPSEAELKAQRDRAERTKQKIVKIWNEVVPLWAPQARPARLWFKRRHVWQDFSNIRDLGYHPSLPYYDDDGRCLGYFPCLVGMIRGVRGDSRTIHRTYLTETGEKAPVPKPRKLHAVPNDLTASGGALQLDVPGVHLNMGEGIETSVGVRLFTGYQPTWALLSKDLLRKVELPSVVKAVTVWADKDLSDGGQSAAAEIVMELRNRGLAAVAMLPPVDIPVGSKGVDWNNMVMNWGVKSIRDNLLFRQWQKSLERILERYSETTPEGTSVAIS